MFFKFLKFELKNSYRLFFMMYALILILSALINITGDSTVVFALIYGILMVTLIIMTCINVIRNYAKSMFTRESYLTHTLPIAEWKLLLVKVLASTIWVALTGLVIVASSYIIAWRLLNQYASDINIQVLGLSLDNLTQIVYMVLSLFEGILMLYFIMTFVHTRYVPRYRVAVGFIMFFVITYVISVITDMSHGNLDDSYSLIFSNSSYSGTNLISNSDMMMQVGFELILMTIFFAGTVYILKNKLEVE